VLEVVVIIPVGPGHAELAECAKESVERAWRKHHGQFHAMAIALVQDLEGRLGRSRVRNMGMDQHQGADWFFFLDADDEMMPDAFRYCDPQGRATFGAVYAHTRWGRLRTNRFPCTRQMLFSYGARGTLSMGFFMPASYGLRFDETMDVGEDFDLYMRLPDFVKVKPPLVEIGYQVPGAGGPRTSVGSAWQKVCAAVIEGYRKKGEHGKVC